MKHNSNKISILGCGWLGKPLARFLIEHGYTLKGSTASEEKLNELSDLGILPYRIVLSKEGLAISDESFFDTDLLIISIPPGIRSGDSQNYPKRLESLLPWIERYSIKDVFFISSTSVYAENGKKVDETDAKPDSDRGMRMLKAEQVIQSGNFNSIIIRMGGLIGPERVPGVLRRTIMKKNGPVNLIHLDDCVRIIKILIEKRPVNEIFNVCAPVHPTRKELYEKISSMGYEVTVKVSEEKDPKRKTVLVKKLVDETGYEFIHPNPAKISKADYQNQI